MSQKPRIMHVFNSALVSGPETLVMPNLQAFEWPVEMTLLQESRNLKGARSVADYSNHFEYLTHHISVCKRVDLKAIRSLRNLISTRKPSLIHAHGPKASLYALLATKSLGSQCTTKLITTNHGVRAADVSYKLKLFETIYELLVMPFYDLCLTVCSTDRDLLIKRGVNPQRLATHFNGVDRVLLDGQVAAAQKIQCRALWAQNLGFSIDPQDYLFGIVGRLAVEKQYELALKAMALLRDQQNLGARAPKLLCFGSGPMEQELKTKTKNLGLENHVFWMGYRNNIAAEMVGLDALLSLSLAEGLPINLIEAGWAGLPVAATAVDGNNDLIISGQSGLLFSVESGPEEVAHILIKLMQSSQETMALGRALQERVSQIFSGKAWVAALKVHYEAVLRP